MVRVCVRVRVWGVREHMMLLLLLATPQTVLVVVHERQVRGVICRLAPRQHGWFLSVKHGRHRGMHGRMMLVMVVYELLLLLLLLLVVATVAVVVFLLAARRRSVSQRNLQKERVHSC